MRLLPALDATACDTANGFVYDLRSPSNSPASAKLFHPLLPDIHRRGVWIPRTPWEALWYGVVQWAGVTDEAAINYILPNNGNFGCNLYSESDLFTDGTASVSGCGGSVVTLHQNFVVPEARVLTPDEQTAFCELVTAFAPVNVRCFIVSQTLREVTGSSRMLTDGTAQYEIEVETEINFEVTEGDVIYEESIDTEAFRTEAALIPQMDGDVVIEQAEVVVVTVTSSPSESPSFEWERDICSIVTSAIFDTLFPNRLPVYTHSGFCSAVENWNADNPDNQIFAADSIAGLRNQLAAFFGNVIHESNSLQATRESSQCEQSQIENDVVYCKPGGYSSGSYTDPYCSTDHNPSSDPDGCLCGSVAESSVVAGYVEANKLYFGRGPLQLSHNYNYIDAGGSDYCATPDLVATDEAEGWASALWFWVINTGSTSTTCADYVANGSFGGTVKTINGGLECPPSGDTNQVISRLNGYCAAASAFSIEALLSMNDCESLSSTLDACISSEACGNCLVWDGVTFEPSNCEYERSSLDGEHLSTFLLTSISFFVCLLFAAPSSSTKPSGEPSLNPSLSTMPSGRPSLSIRPSEAIAIAPYYGHVLVGFGNCVGKVGGNHVFETSQYNYLEFEDSLFVAASLCPGTCAAYRTHINYRGFEFETGKCRCLFDGGIDFSTVTHPGGSPDVTNDENTAAGAVTDSNDSGDSVRCYKTSLPVAPETVDGFEYIGFGDCWDSSMATYDYTPLSSESNTAVQCGAACSLSNYPLSRGFFTKQGTVCNCLFDADFTDSSVDITDNGDGTGQIVSSNYVAGHCYRALPAPTPKPTKTPTPKPVSTKAIYSLI